MLELSNCEQFDDESYAYILHILCNYRTYMYNMYLLQGIIKFP
jgi:hypothetical protein